MHAVFVKLWHRLQRTLLWAAGFAALVPLAAARASVGDAGALEGWLAATAMPVEAATTSTVAAINWTARAKVHFIGLSSLMLSVSQIVGDEGAGAPGTLNEVSASLGVH